MIEVLKGESEKTYHSLKNFIIGYTVIFLFLWVLPKDLLDTNNMFAHLFMLVISISMAFGVLYLGIFPTFNIITYVQGKQDQIEGLRDILFYKVMIAKMFLNAIVILSTLGISSLGTFLMAKFATETHRYFLFIPTQPWYGVCLEVAIFIPTLFAYIYSMVSQRTKYGRGAYTILLAIVVWAIVSSVHTNDIRTYLLELIILIPMVWRTGIINRKLQGL